MIMFMKTKALISTTLLVLLSLNFVSAAVENDQKKNDSDIPRPVTFSNKCFEDLGCFDTGKPFYHPILRPISLPPFDPKKMNTSFWLYTRTQKDKSCLLEPNQECIAASTFDEKLPIKFVIHGFMNSLEKDDVVFALKDALLEEGDYNVIIVDWSGGNGPPYSQAVANTRVVGAQIAQLVEFLKRTRRIKLESVHLIGHSLGAHVAGYAGERLPNLARISGVDPAGPFFTGTAKEVRLDSSDATFVDNIHTNAGLLVVDGLGTPDPMGDLDFYPNGGKEQPSCKRPVKNDTKDTDGEGSTSAGCSSHGISNDYYLESIITKNITFIGTMCKSYEVYKAGGCKNNKKAVMGFMAQKISGVTPDGDRFYLDTNAKPPYCIPEESP